MSHFEDLFKAMSEGARLSRGNYHLTLYKLLKELEGVPDAALITFDTGGYPDQPYSYRGYYSDLCFSRSDQEITVKDFIGTAKDCLDKTFQGYKGGDYVMAKDTPLWVAEYGSCGDAIIGIKPLSSDNVILQTKYVD